jgi:hypothetical protein
MVCFQRDLNLSKTNAAFNSSTSRLGDDTLLSDKLKMLDPDFEPIPAQILRKVYLCNFKIDLEFFLIIKLVVHFLC